MTTIFLIRYITGGDERVTPIEAECADDAFNYFSKIQPNDVDIIEVTSTQSVNDVRQLLYA